MPYETTAYGSYSGTNHAVTRHRDTHNCTFLRLCLPCVNMYVGNIYTPATSTIFTVIKTTVLLAARS